MAKKPIHKKSLLENDDKYGSFADFRKAFKNCIVAPAPKKQAKKSKAAKQETSEVPF